LRVSKYRSKTIICPGACQNCEHKGPEDSCCTNAGINGPQTRESIKVEIMNAEAKTLAQGPCVLSAHSGGVATLTLNRPERFNPLSTEMIAVLQAELDSIAADSSVRVIILAAQGRGFSAGHDLKEMRAHAGDKVWKQKLFDDCSRMMMTLTQLPQPVIARVHAIATAAGCQLVSMCDLAVAADTAKFAMPGVNIGVFCSTPAVGVARNIGRKRAMEMLITGEPIDAKTALSWGLVNRVVPAEKLDAEVRHFVDSVLARSPATIKVGKQTFYRQIDRSLEAAYDLASEAMVGNLLLDDAAEGMDAFLEKRPANWRGR
jgi:enoyl-CoA hydratase/carnithine racemase